MVQLYCAIEEYERIHCNVDFYSEKYGAVYRGLMSNFEVMEHDSDLSLQLLNLRKSLYKHGM